MDYLTSEFRAGGATQIGFALMTIVVAVRWLRLGDRWAWIVLWFLPVFFAWSAFTTWTWFLFLTLAILGAAALVATHRYFLPAKRSQSHHSASPDAVGQRGYDSSE